MKNTRWFLSLLLVGLLCVTAQADVIPTGFQGVFGDVEVNPLTYTEGFTSGETVGDGISAAFDDLVIDLTGYSSNGGAVSISDLVLIGINGCTGSATYVWDFATLTHVVTIPSLSIGAGYIIGELTLQSGGNFLTASPEAVIFPESIAATITYNGVVVSTNGTDGSAATFAFPSASITANAIVVPEPSTIICLITGLGAFLIWRRRK